MTAPVATGWAGSALRFPWRLVCPDRATGTQVDIIPQIKKTHCRDSGVGERASGGGRR